MSLTSLPLVEERSGPNNPSVDVEALRTALEASITGEVRFEKLSRALYSTDASVYQIVPLGVVLPKSVADVQATVKICSSFGVPITARGGGTSQAGQSIGPGVILDFSKYLNQVLELNPPEHWVRVQPGCVLEDLNQQVRAAGLQFAPDISTASRATIGGMVANNSSGTHSIVYGKTIDHVLELIVLLAGGEMVHLRSLSETELEQKTNQKNQEGLCYRTVLQLAREHEAEIDRRFPKILRRVGGYNLDAFVRRPSGGRQPPVAAFQQGADAPRSAAASQQGADAPRSAAASQQGADAPRSAAASQQGADAPRSPGKMPLPHSRINLASLFVGSEGTLGIVLEAKLRLVEMPKARAVLVVQFSDLLQALAAVPSILTHQPAAVEVMDQFILDCTKLNAEAARLRDFLRGDPGAILIIEFYGESSAELPARLNALATDLSNRNHGEYQYQATDAAAQARIWKLRTLALGLSMSEKGDAKALSFVEDTAVAPEHLRDYIAEFLAIIARHGTTAGVYAHASVGCLHVRPIINLKTPEGVQRFQDIAQEVAELVLKYGGALSGEHGDGLVRSPFQEKMFGPALYQAFRDIKRTFDPRQLLNPGKIVDAPPLTTNLRYGPAYITPEVSTTFDFSSDGGLVRSAELCAGVGECRKKRGGTMCPSYQATREEQHSTRGRANTLRLALTGQLGLKGFTDPAVFAALDLCLECKACKSECPTNVDMARLKAEFLHQYHQQHGLPWRNWLFGHVATLSKWGCRLAPMSNWLTTSWPGRWLNDKVLGIDLRRFPPRFSSHPFLLQELVRKARQTDNPQQPRVLLFPDTFMNYHEPEIGLAAMEVLQQLNYRVVPGWLGPTQPKSVPSTCWPDDLRCCGRPMISNGMLSEAVAHAKHNVQQLFPWASQGQPIIACEPSCILTIKDDYPALLQGEYRQQAKIVAEKCFTFEEFAENALSSFNAPAVIKGGPKRILLQNHCHQCSLIGNGPSLRLLRRIPGTMVTDLDAGCCGMAGSFGYEKEHYEISRLVGEQRLFPILRQAELESVVVAPGFSCRMQIEHFTGRRALHPATLLRSLLVTPTPATAATSDPPHRTAPTPQG